MLVIVSSVLCDCETFQWILCDFRFRTERSFNTVGYAIEKSAFAKDGFITLTDSRSAVWIPKAECNLMHSAACTYVCICSSRILVRHLIRILFHHQPTIPKMMNNTVDWINYNKFTTEVFLLNIFYKNIVYDGVN